MDEVCIICRSPVGTLATVSAKGLNTLLCFSKKRDETDIYAALLASQENNNKLYVHESCRKPFTDKRKLEQAKSESKQRKTKSAFDFTTNCIYCNEPCANDKKNPARKTWHSLLTSKKKQKIFDTCNERLKQNSEDRLALEVKARASACLDLVAAKAKYHSNCRTCFEVNTSGKSDTRGRKEDPEHMESFKQACAWLEQETEIHTITDFKMKIQALHEDKPVFGAQYLKLLLKKKYGNEVSFSTEKGSHTLIYFSDTAKATVMSKFNEQSCIKEKVVEQEEEEKVIIRRAANLLRTEILKMNINTEEYPNSSDIKEKFIPDKLKLFLSSLITSSLRQESIGQCIVKSVSPHLLPPILFGLSVELDNLFGSRWLNDELFKLGFGVSYTEVTKFKQACVINQSGVFELHQADDDSSFTQFIADNVDHNVVTLDGKGTFHGMGIIAATVSSQPKVPKESRLKKLTKKLSTEDLLTESPGVSIREYLAPLQSKFQDVRFKPVIQMCLPYVYPQILNLDLQWNFEGLSMTAECPRPNWSGYMALNTSGDHLPKATITFLPIIDLNPSSYSCVYSTLTYVVEQCRKFHIHTPSITFDQPLWLKATEISMDKNLDVVVHLGGFHTLMSFMGSVGAMMDGSGISSVLETIYGENTVKHMMSGKAISRSIRGHLLVSTALYKILAEMVFSEDSASGFSTMSEAEFQEIKGLVNSNESFSDSDVVKKFTDCIEKLKLTLSKKSRTAKLWIQYLDYVETMRQYICAARSGDWNLSLATLQQMLNLFAATGHINYAKSARLYLQLMMELPHTNPWLHEKLSSEGNHFIRRTDKFWAGLWPDLVIEQVLMRSVKNRGGLTRGRGMTPSVRTLWIESMHKCGEIHQAMTQVTDHLHTTGEQHQELGKTRIQRDFTDLQKVQAWFHDRNPFKSGDAELCSLACGLTADESVNCDNTELIGKQIHDSLDDQQFKNSTIKRTSQVKSLASMKNKVKISKQTVNIDPGILFTRLVVLLERYEDVKLYFAYELTPIPTSLFQENLMRKTNKAVFVQNMFGKDFQFISSTRKSDVIVVDGGSLLRKITWNEGMCFGDILDAYKRYVTEKHGKAVVIFDGYPDEPTPKDHEHDRRSQGKCPDFSVDINMKVTVTQQLFLSNSSNKDKLIKLMIPMLEQDKHVMKQAVADADTWIVSAALENATNGKSVNVYANDTDILLMLVFHWKDQMADITVESSTSSQGKKRCKVFDVRKASEMLDSDSKQLLLFMHAFGGCDTTSAIYDKGKQAIKKLIEKSEEAKELAKVFMNSEADQDTIGKAGIKLFVLLYGGKPGDTLTMLRHTAYMKMTALSSRVVPGKLPPSDRAAHYHSLRVYLQVCTWIELQECKLNCSDWGWTVEKGKMIPIMTDQEVAPPDLLKVIRCNCKMKSKNPCSSQLCSCRQNGLSCVSACGDCRGLNCANQQNEHFSDDEDVEEML